MPEREVSSNKSDPSENQITESVASPQDGDEEGKTPMQSRSSIPLLARANVFRCRWAEVFAREGWPEWPKPEEVAADTSEDISTSSNPRSLEK